jgi:hypothetical protein
VRQRAAQKAEVVGAAWRARVSRLIAERDAFVVVWGPQSRTRTRYIAINDVNCSGFEFTKEHFIEAVKDWREDTQTLNTALDIFHSMLPNSGIGVLSLDGYVKAMQKVFADFDSIPEVLSFMQGDHFLKLEGLDQNANVDSQWHFVVDALGNKGRVRTDMVIEKEAPLSHLEHVYLVVKGYGWGMAMTFEVVVASIPVVLFSIATFLHLSNWTLYMNPRNIMLLVTYILLAVTLAMHFPPFTLVVPEGTDGIFFPHNQWYVDLIHAATLGLFQGMTFVEQDRSAFEFEAVQQVLVWRLCARIKRNVILAAAAALRHTSGFMVGFYGLAYLAGWDYFFDVHPTFADECLAYIGMLWNLFMCGFVTCFCWEFARDCVEAYETQLPTVWLDEVSPDQVKNMINALSSSDGNLQRMQLVFTGFGRMALCDTFHFMQLFESDASSGKCLWTQIVEKCAATLKSQAEGFAGAVSESNKGTPIVVQPEPGHGNGPQYRVGWTPLTTREHWKQLGPVGQPSKTVVHRLKSIANRADRKLKLWSTPRLHWLDPTLTQADALELLRGREDGHFLVHMYEPGIASVPLRASDRDPDLRTSYSITVVRDSILRTSKDKKRRSATHWTGTIIQDQHQFQLLEAPNNQAKKKFATQGVGFESYDALLDYRDHGGQAQDAAGNNADASPQFASLERLVEHYHAREAYQLPACKLASIKTKSIVNKTGSKVWKSILTFVADQKEKLGLQSSSKWNCGLCTMLNEQDATKCIMCESPRSSGGGQIWHTYRTVLVIIRTMSILVERAGSVSMNGTRNLIATQTANDVLKEVLSSLLQCKLAIDAKPYSSSVGKKDELTDRLFDVVLDEENIEVHTPPGMKTNNFVSQDFGIQSELNAAMTRILCSFPLQVAGIASELSSVQQQLLRARFFSIRTCLEQTLSREDSSRLHALLHNVEI